MMIKRAVLDTNILVSALVFGGLPRQILQLVISKKIVVVTSPVLVAELLEVLSKKFKFLMDKLKLVEKKVRKNFFLVQPAVSLNVLKDKADNHVLEAAVEGNCHHIVTGDKELLQLKKFKNISIITNSQYLKFLNIFL